MTAVDTHAEIMAVAAELADRYAPHRVAYSETAGHRCVTAARCSCGQDYGTVAGGRMRPLWERIDDHLAAVAVPGGWPVKRCWCGRLATRGPVGEWFHVDLTTHGHRAVVAGD